jgi:preprotein translocase subunit Sec61beta
MASDKQNAAGGLMSSAGLTTYYDAETENIALNPKTIFLFTVFISLLMISLNVVI